MAFITEDKDSVRVQIQTYRRLGDYESGRIFYESLPANVQQNKVVAREIAQLYLVQGQYKLATQACLTAALPMFPCETMNDEPASEVWDDDCVALEMCRAYTEISHSGDLADALRVAKIVHGIWLSGERKVFFTIIRAAQKY